MSRIVTAGFAVIILLTIITVALAAVGSLTLALTSVLWVAQVLVFLAMCIAAALEYFLR